VKRLLLFDSGVGGLSVFDAIAAAHLPLDIDYAADTAWLPYGDKPDEAIRERVVRLLAALARSLAPDLIVMACNTASTIALDAARAAIALPIVGVVPPIKPAAEMTKTGTIALLATPATIARSYTDDLIARFAPDARVLRYGSTRLVEAAEAKLAGRRVDPGAASDAIAHLFGAEGGDRIDVVALACTHFPLLREELAAAAPRACIWLDSGAAIARRVGALLGVAAGESARCAQRARAALFTEPAHAARGAFAERGFAAFSAIGAAPDFAVAPANLSGAA
jgi:glutamate racemase